jgi:hypothetical protein
VINLSHSHRINFLLPWGFISFSADKWFPLYQHFGQFAIANGGIRVSGFRLALIANGGIRVLGFYSKTVRGIAL